MLWFGLKKRIERLEKTPLARRMKFGKNKKDVLVYDNRAEAIVRFFSERLEKLEKNRTTEIEEARDEAYDDAMSSEARDE